MRLVSPTKQAFDLDNRTKAVLDLLVAHHVIESDDCGIVKEITLELGDTGTPGASIEIAPHAATRKVPLAEHIAP
jgi:hypothetical protein